MKKVEIKKNENKVAVITGGNSGIGWVRLKMVHKPSPPQAVVQLVFGVHLGERHAFGNGVVSLPNPQEDLLLRPVRSGQPGLGVSNSCNGYSRIVY